jgi:hypothetical protein
VESLPPEVIELPPVGGEVGVDPGAVPVSVPADRGPLGHQPVLVAEMGQQLAGVVGLAGIEGRGENGRRLPGGQRNVFVAGHRALHHGAQQVPLVAPVRVQGLHGDVGPLGDPDHGGRGVAPFRELGAGGDEQPPARLAPDGLARFALPAHPPGPGLRRVRRQLL